eukprot:427629-Prymnesium_polylepis.1
MAGGVFVAIAPDVHGLIHPAELPGVPAPPTDDGGGGGADGGGAGAEGGIGGAGGGGTGGGMDGSGGGVDSMGVDGSGADSMGVDGGGADEAGEVRELEVGDVVRVRVVSVQKPHEVRLPGGAPRVSLSTCLRAPRAGIEPRAPLH